MPAADSHSLEIKAPYLLFLGDAPDALAAKTAQGIVDWRPERCIGQLRLPGCRADTGLPDMRVAEAARQGARTLVVGAVNPGGVLPEPWLGTLTEALEAGLDVASGMHERLADVPLLREKAAAKRCRLFDVRHNTQRFAVGKGTKRTGLRVLTVGTDCSVGKKYAALALEREMRARGLDATFRATGQTGVLIAGSGVVIDSVVADFISGAVEWLTPDNAPGHWDIIEGQGSLHHPSFAGVSLGLLHGAQPDFFVVCHEPTRTRMRGVNYPLPSLQETIGLVSKCGRLTNPAISCAGIAVNTAALAEADAADYLARTGAALGLPCVDPLRDGMAAIADVLQQAAG